VAHRLKESYRIQCSPPVSEAQLSTTSSTKEVSKARGIRIRNNKQNLLCGRAIVESHDQLVSGAFRVYDVCHQAQHVQIVRSQYASADGKVPSQLRE
jgi:hypothetical protein